jgi:hypothetical protein
MPVCREGPDNPIIFMSKNERLAMHGLSSAPVIGYTPRSHSVHQSQVIL